ncbi:amidase family protein [Ureaplasma canigenitalium]|uniref:amidase family protein n=1 Tax=Ureaplasma canigenitalium TaxID=42092 RepID=UPI0004E25C77|nr:amidase family protein [Ureaplasma canigenitalium]
MKNQTIRELHNLLVRNETSVSELVKNAIAKSIGIDVYNADITENYDDATDQALTLDETEIKEGDYLFGIPYSLKDNISTKNIRTTGGSRFLSKYIPCFSSTVHDLLNNQKAILISKNNLDEFGFGGTGLFSGYNDVINPLNPEQVTGGSSSGSAVVVSQNVVPFAIATDTGDSIRRPASIMGIVGYKPSYGLVSRYGVFPFSVSMDHVGFFTNDVYDVAILMDALAKYDPKDATSIKLENEYVKNLKIDKELKLKVLTPAINLLDKNYQTEFLKLIDKLRQNNHKVDIVEYDMNLVKAISSVYQIIAYAEGYSSFSNLTNITFGNQDIQYENYVDLIYKARDMYFNSEIKRRFMIGAYILNEENIDSIFIKAKKMRRLIVEKTTSLINDDECLIMLGAHDVAELVSDVKSNDVIPNVYDDLLQIANFGGLPSITIPFLKLHNGNIGLNISGKHLNDQTVLNAAYTIEKMLNGGSNE